MADATDERESDVWRTLYRVAQTAASPQDLPAFYRGVHGIVGELMDATNLFTTVRRSTPACPPAVEAHGARLG